MKEIIQQKLAEYTRLRDDKNQRATDLEAAARSLRMDAVACHGAMQACEQLLKQCELSSPPASPAS